MAFANAEASSSRLPRSGFSRRKSQDALKNTTSGGALSRITSPASTHGTNGESVRRSVRTVPPLAAFEPPTPPESPHDDPASGSLPNHSKSSTAVTNTTISTRKQRRMPKMRYDSSDSSADDTDTDTSDDEPPWWTFTHRGMAKMRARTLGNKGTEEGELDYPATSGVESGREGTKEHRLRRGSRQSSKQKEKRSTPTPSIHNDRDRNILAPPVNIRPRNSNSHSLLWRRSAGRELPLPPTMALESTPMARSSSAPVSPIILPNDVAISPGMTTIVGSIDDVRSGDAEIVTKTKRSMTESRPIPAPKRQMTAPTFPRFLKRSDQDIHTDTETNGATLPRAKQREKLNGIQATGGSLPAPSTESATESFSTPYRPRTRRMQTSRLRLNLPDNLQQHLAAQWPGGRPHAGTWQDAYYGYYSENQAEEASRRRSTGSRAPSRKGSDTRESASITSRRPSRIRELDATPEDSGAASGAATPVARQPSRRRKPRKMRRYRTGLAPPTPVGLGFSPNGTKRDNESWKEGRVGAGQNGFDWGNHHSSALQTGITKSPEPSAIIDSQAFNEKTGAKEELPKGPWWRFGRQKKQMYSHGRAEEISWQKKMRRMLFLDARVTIYIRLVNLVVVVVSLALAVRIRLQLDQLQVPGLLGASTTLLIAFSSLTAFHVLSAIYREYFGKPIGLWGLRSKMLWVCLDLAFIAFWSSALSLAINDYIATPLECTPLDPWWRGGLVEQYENLLHKLHLASGITVTPVEAINHSMGIILPAEITQSSLADDICDKQVGSIALALLTMLLYTGNMVLSLFRIFETVRRTANVDRAVMV